jgi:hypothetical protein
VSSSRIDPARYDSQAQRNKVESDASGAAARFLSIKFNVSKLVDAAVD